MELKPSSLTEGTVELSISGKLRIWKSQTQRGAANLIATATTAKTWDLSDGDEQEDFTSLCSSLYVEGIGTGSATITLTYKNPSGESICNDTISYTIIAAVCGKQPWKTFRQSYLQSFPNLVGCEWSVTNVGDAGYNCIAWSVGITNQVIWDEVDSQYGDNDGEIETSDFDAFYDAKGYETCAAAQATIMLYKKPDGTITHAARKLSSCKCGAGKWDMWDSKMGSQEARIEHRRTQINGNNYGAPFRYYKKKG
jgi:hypothetical protein